jgi:4-hydroxybenzoate polyprenyltransferase
MLQALLPYWYLARWHRPVGTLLLMFPCWWGIVYFGRQDFFFENLMWLTLGAAAMRGAGCCVNDWFDQEFDRQIHRTRNRPLAQNQLTAYRVFLFLGLHLLIGLIVLWQFPFRAWGSAFLGAGLMVIYPLMKRITNYPQVILGLAFNIGIWVGAAIANAAYLDHWLPLFLLYIAGICWTLGYDTIYAVQDRKEDIGLGIGSTAIIFGSLTKPIVTGIYGVALLLLLAVGFLSHKSLFFIIVLGVAFGQILLQLKRLDLENGAKCDGFFRANIWFGFWVFIALALG